MMSGGDRLGVRGSGLSLTSREGCRWQEVVERKPEEMTPTERNPFVPHNEVQPLMTGLRWAHRWQVWAQMDRLRADARTRPLAEEKFAYYESNYRLWQALRQKEMVFYWRDARTSLYWPMNLDELELSAVMFAAEKSLAGYHALAEWAHGTRSYDEAFHMQLEVEEFRSGYYVESLLALLHIREVELVAWLRPEADRFFRWCAENPDEFEAIGREYGTASPTEVEPSVTENEAPPEPKEAREPKARKHIYVHARAILESAPN